MKTLLFFLIAAAAVFAGGIPSGARQVEPGIYRKADKSGKVWLYRETPFGVMRYEEAKAKPAAARPDNDITAVDQGDRVQFEGPGPFGRYRWTRDKSQLNEAEKAAWERTRARPE